MTAAEIITEIREHLDEPAPSSTNEDSYYTDTRILSLINRKYRNIVKKTGCIWRMTNFVDTSTTTRNAVASTAGDPRHYLPVTFWMVHPIMGVRWNVGGGYWLEGKEKLGMFRDEHSWNGLQNSGTPEVYEVEFGNMDEYDDVSSGGVGIGKTMNVYPYPAASGNLLQAFYIPAVTDLTLTDSPLFDEEFHETLIYMPAAEFKLKRKEHTDYKYYVGLATARMGDMVRYYSQKATDARKQIPKSKGRGSRPGGISITSYP